MVIALTYRIVSLKQVKLVQWTLQHQFMEHSVTQVVFFLQCHKHTDLKGVNFLTITPIYSWLLFIYQIHSDPEVLLGLFSVSSCELPDCHNVCCPRQDAHRGTMPAYFRFLTILAFHVFLQEEVWSPGWAFRHVKFNTEKHHICVIGGFSCNWSWYWWSVWLHQYYTVGIFIRYCSCHL